MKKTMLLLLGLVVLAPAFPAAAYAQDEKCAQINFNVFGMRKLLSDDWKPANEQDELGIGFDVKGDGWPLSLDVAYFYATAKGTADEILTQGNVTTQFTDLKRKASIQELNAGIRKTWTDKNGFSLFVGGGAAWTIGRLEFTGVTSFDEAALGWYGTAGAYYTAMKFLNLGIIGRFSDAELNIAGRDRNAGGWHYGFLAGISF